MTDDARPVRRALVVLSVALLGGGAIAARSVEPGVRVTPLRVAWGEGRELAALRFSPEGDAAAPRPVALLAHGITASKETLFVVAEGLAASGFDALALDLPGHGESPGPFALRSFSPAFAAAASAVTSGAHARVVVGHSLGAHLAARAIEDGTIDPDLLVAFGATPHTSRTLFLLGEHDELIERRALEASAPPDARIVGSRWSDHATEPWDPVLVRAALEAACERTGLTPRMPTRWRVRLVGAVAAALGALGLVAFACPRGPLGARRGALAGAAAGVVAIGALVLGAGYAWVGASFQLARLPQQMAFGLAALGGSLVAAFLFERVGLVRARASAGQVGGALFALALAGANAATGAAFLALVLGLGAGVVLACAGVGAVAARRTGEPWAAHAAFAVTLGYAVGQWLPLLY